MSEMPVNQAAPPPTAGPLSARTKTFLWSIMERSISSAEILNVSPIGWKPSSAVRSYEMQNE